MPNWCNNKLTIVGDSNELEQVKSLLFKENGEFSFNCAVPQPDNLSRDAVSFSEMEKLQKKGIPHWYNWNNLNWGTKWDANNVYNTEITDEHIEIFFDTAWSPPEQWFYGLCDKIESTNLHIEMLYEEWGQWFAGAYVREKGFTDINHYDGEVQQLDSYGNVVSYDPNTARYRNSKGHFVNSDEIIIEANYGY